MKINLKALTITLSLMLVFSVMASAMDNSGLDDKEWDEMHLDIQKQISRLEEENRRRSIEKHHAVLLNTIDNNKMKNFKVDLVIFVNDINYCFYNNIKIKMSSNEMVLDDNTTIYSPNLFSN